MSSEYAQAIEQAKKNLADARERGAEALGNWRELFAPEQIAEAESEVDRQTSEEQAKEPAA